MTANDARKRTEEARKRSYWLFDEVMVAIKKAADDGNYQANVEIYSSFPEDVEALIADLVSDGYKANYWPNTNILTIDWV